MLGHRLRRWPNIKVTLVEVSCLQGAVYVIICVCCLQVVGDRQLSQEIRFTVSINGLLSHSVITLINHLWS